MAALCLQSLQCTTLVGGNVGSVHTTRSLAGHDHVAMWPCGHDHAPIQFVDNVDNVVTCFKSLAKPWGVSIREPYNLLYSYIVLQQHITSSVSFLIVHIVHKY